jgi:hypothetical protein
MVHWHVGPDGQNRRPRENCGRVSRAPGESLHLVADRPSLSRPRRYKRTLAATRSSPLLSQFILDTAITYCHASTPQE